MHLTQPDVVDIERRARALRAAFVRRMISGLVARLRPGARPARVARA